MEDQILVIGGTGLIGRSLVKLLQSGNTNYKVLVRSNDKAKSLQENGIKTVQGELGDWPTIESALIGVDTVFLLTSPSNEKVEQQNGLIDRAKKIGVRKIVKISAVIAKTGSEVHLANWHGQIEDHLKNSGLDYIILRPHSFMQNMLLHINSIKGQDCFYESMGDSKIPMIDTRDIAQASFDCLISDDFNNQTFVLTGPSPISYGEMAEALSRATNRQINYIQVPSEAHNQGMKEAGLPDWLADDLSAMSRDWSQQSIHQPSTDFRIISKTEQIDVDKFADDYATLFN